MVRFPPSVRTCHITSNGNALFEDRDVLRENHRNRIDTKTLKNFKRKEGMKTEKADGKKNIEIKMEGPIERSLIREAVHQEW